MNVLLYKHYTVTTLLVTRSGLFDPCRGMRPLQQVNVHFIVAKHCGQPPTHLELLLSSDIRPILAVSMTIKTIIAGFIGPVNVDKDGNRRQRGIWRK